MSLTETFGFSDDDITLLMTHTRGTRAHTIHHFAWDCFIAATEIAQEEGCYGAGQDLLADAPSGNFRGAGPGVADSRVRAQPHRPDQPAEAFTVSTADKCGPGAYLPVYVAFCDPMHDGGLLLNPKMHKGFAFEIIDMDYKGEMGHGDKLIRLDVPERAWDVAALLQNIDRFAIESMWSRHKPDEQVASIAATRLQNIAGKYTGKDDPIAIVRTQGIFPAPEEVTEPFLINPVVTDDARGSHVMPLLPVPINTAVNGPYWHPLCSAVAFSMTATGHHLLADAHRTTFSTSRIYRTFLVSASHDWDPPGSQRPEYSVATNFSDVGSGGGGILWRFCRIVPAILFLGSFPPAIFNGESRQNWMSEAKRLQERAACA